MPSKKNVHRIVSCFVASNSLYNFLDFKNISYGCLEDVWKPNVCDVDWCQSDSESHPSSIPPMWRCI